MVNFCSPFLLPELRQLRSVTSMELGCDPHGYSRAGYDTMIWYCAIVVGRPSLELNRMREVCLLSLVFGHNLFISRIMLILVPYKSQITVIIIDTLSFDRFLVK